MRGRNARQSCEGAMATTIKIQRPPSCMQLLVSPCSIEEARQALAADIIDIKNPREGSLGANFPWVIREVRAMTNKPLSAAIGDYPFKPGGASLAAFGAACAGADYIKAGLMFDGQKQAEEFISAMVKAVKDEYPEKSVVIAGYADYERLGTISPLLLPPLVARAGADVAMIDTGIKDGKSLFDFIGESLLSHFIRESHDLGLETALAGSLTFNDLDDLRAIGPDIIGVRGMVCGGDRNSAIRADLVKKVMGSIR
jgi:uncharacterized protein (UPF0264 family)